MLALPQEYIGAACEVKSMDNDLLAAGRIIKIDTEALEIAAPDDGRLPLLQYRMPVKLFVHANRLDTRILVAIVYLSTENFIRVEEVKPLQNFERRGAFRVNTNIIARFTPILSAAERTALDEKMLAMDPEEAQKAEEALSFDVRVMDVSLTGMRVHSDIPLVPGARYFIDFKLLDAALNLCLRVQRIITMSNRSIQYGCTFFDFSERQMDVLCKELFQLQRVEKSRRMNSVTAM